eukprot:COSAG01_NODE_21071_length_919_cov_1.569512_1_plen_260_part_00
MALPRHRQFHQTERLVETLCVHLPSCVHHHSVVNNPMHRRRVCAAASWLFTHGVGRWGGSWPYHHAARARKSAHRYYSAPVDAVTTRDPSAAAAAMSGCTPLRVSSRPRGRVCLASPQQNDPPRRCHRRRRRCRCELALSAVDASGWRSLGPSRRASLPSQPAGSPSAGYASAAPASASPRCAGVGSSAAAHPAPAFPPARTRTHTHTTRTTARHGNTFTSRVGHQLAVSPLPMHQRVRACAADAKSKQAASPCRRASR